MLQPLIDQCHKCFKVYGPDEQKYPYYSCPHRVCFTCFCKLATDKETNLKCGICGRKSYLNLEFYVHGYSPKKERKLGTFPKFGEICCLPRRRPQLEDAPRELNDDKDPSSTDRNPYGVSTFSVEKIGGKCCFDQQNSQHKNFQSYWKEYLIFHKKRVQNSEVGEDQHVIEEQKVPDMPKPQENKCSKCATKTEEQDLYICETCYEEEDVDTEANIKTHAICANCAIRNHIREGHKTLDLSDYSKKLSDAHDEMKLKLDVFKADQLECTTALAEFASLVETLGKKHRDLLDQARRSRSTNSLVNTFEKLRIVMEQSKDIMAKTNSEIGKLAEDAEVFLFSTIS